MTRPQLQVVLTAQEDCTLRELRTFIGLPQSAKGCAEVLRLSHHGLTTEKIAGYFGWPMETVRETIHRLERKGWGGLWDDPHRGHRPSGKIKIWLT